MAKRAPKKASKLQSIQITELDGTVKVIGKYNPEKRLFICPRKKSEHFMRKFNSWGLDQKVVEFLVKEHAEILVKDTESKWEYKCEAVDFTLYGKIEEYKDHRPQYFLPLDMWEIVKITNRSMVVECQENDCRFNFANQCIRGVIQINDRGECDGYEDKQNGN